MVRVLLDEDLPIRLRLHFPDDIEVRTVEYQGWKGLKNGDLLEKAAVEFDAFLTMDDSLPDQQNLRRYNIAVVVLRARTKRLKHLLDLMPELLEKLPACRPGEAIRILPSESPPT